MKGGKNIDNNGSDVVTIVEIVCFSLSRGGYVMTLAPSAAYVHSDRISLPGII